MRQRDRRRLGKAVATAIEPIVELLLEFGVTSPEAESLLRSVYVHRARARLATSLGRCKAPSDVHVALITGIHRNFVRQILSGPPNIPSDREHRGSTISRVLHTWQSNPRYLSADGVPLDLAEEGERLSFQSLVSQTLPGVAPSAVMAELRARGLVKLLPDHRVRISLTADRQQLKPGEFAEFAHRSNLILSALRRNLTCPESGLLCAEVTSVSIDESQLPGLRQAIRQRAPRMLESIARELAVSAKAEIARPRKRRRKMKITLIETTRAL
jgi:hypothetical protein